MGIQQQIVHRRARIREPLPCTEIKIPSPKQLPSKPGKPDLMMFLPVIVMALATGGISFFVQRNANAATFIIPMMLMGGTMMGVQMWRHRSSVKTYEGEVARINTEYQNRLATLQDELEKNAQEQRRILCEEHPGFQELTRRVNYHHRTRRLWERQPDNDDFLCVRIGTGDLPNCTKVKMPESDDPRISAAIALADSYKTVADLPIRVNLNRLGSVGVEGSRPAEFIPLVYTLLLNVVVHHSPDEVYLYLFSHREQADRLWGWCRWLPHTNCLQPTGGVNRLSFSPATDEEVLSELVKELRQRIENDSKKRRGDKIRTGFQPHLVVVIDQAPELAGHSVTELLLRHNPGLDEKNNLSASVVFVQNPIPASINAQIVVQGDHLDYREMWRSSANQDHYQGKAEQTQLKAVEHLARKLAPLKTAVRPPDSSDLPTNVRLVELFDAAQPDGIDLTSLYSDTYKPDQVMVFPVGRNVDRKPEILTLREREDGLGATHAMLAGMSGQGKSVLLQSMALSLVLKHPPQFLNLVLADFKGEGELAKLRELPHTAGFVTDLQDPAAVERFRIALESEIDRRNQIFAGYRVTKLSDYNKIQAHDPLPHLVIILDEFARGLFINPEMRTTIDRIAAQGRSLGIHLILSTQRATGFDHKIRPNIGMRISLRVAGADESKIMFNRDEAFSQLARPGQALVQIGDNHVFEMFQAARANVPYQPDGSGTLDLQDDFTIFEVSADGRRSTFYEHESQAKTTQKKAVNMLTEADVIVDKIRAYCEGRYAAARQVCLPPLPSSDRLPLSEILGRFDGFQTWGETWSDSPQLRTRLQAPIGIVDIPQQQSQQDLIIDLQQRDGNYLVVGPAGAGKSLFLRTLIASLAMTHSPEHLHIYILSRSARLDLFDTLPHCGGVIRAVEGERIIRLFNFLRQEKERRLSLMRETRVGSIDALRLAQKEPLPAILLVLEDFVGFKSERPDDIAEIVSLASDGRQVDIHLVISSTTGDAIHPRIKDNLQNRLGLGLKSPGDYKELLGERGNQLKEIEGRGYIAQDKVLLECQIASPDQISGMIEQMDGSWTGPRPRRIEILPKYLELEQLWEKTVKASSSGLVTAPIGREYEQLNDVCLDLSRLEQFTLIVGPAESGKSEFILSFCLAAAYTLHPDQVQIYLLAFGNTQLAWLSGLSHVHFAGSPQQAKALLEKLSEKLKAQASAPKSQPDSGVISAPAGQTLLIIDDLLRFSRSRQSELNGLVDECIEASPENLKVFLADTGSNINTAKQNFTLKYIQSALRIPSGVVFSLEQADYQQMTKQYLKQPFVQLHAANIGKGRGLLYCYLGQELVVQFARVGPANEEMAERQKRVQRIIQQITLQYPTSDPS